MTRHPELAPVFDRLGLDYCCGGGRTLGDAVAAAAAWTDLGPAALVDHIEATHHIYLADALPRLEALATKLVGIAAEDAVAETNTPG